MGVPSVASSNTATGTPVAGNALSIPMPSGLATGDVCLIVCGNDAINSADQWDNGTNKPTGFTLIDEWGDTPSDSHVAAFYRVIDGTESWPITLTCVTNLDTWAFSIRVTGCHATPLDGTASTALELGTPGTSHAVPGFNTTNNDCLAFYVWGCGVGDADPFSVSGTGWSEGGELEANPATGGTAGAWGTKSQPTAGATGDATVTSTGSTTSTGFQFALRGASNSIAAISHYLNSLRASQ